LSENVTPIFSRQRISFGMGFLGKAVWRIPFRLRRGMPQSAEYLHGDRVVHAAKFLS
jgi:hypothetical protein